MTASINSKTSTQKIYEQIRRIKGSPPKGMAMIVDNSRVFKSTTEIISKVEDTFTDISSSRNYF